MAGHPHRPDHGQQLPAHLAVALHLARCLADRLDHERNRAAFTVVVGNRKWHPFAFRVGHHDDELARARGLGQHRMTHLEQEGDVREILPAHDRVTGPLRCQLHYIPPFNASLVLNVSGETNAGISRCASRVPLPGANRPGGGSFVGSGLGCNSCTRLDRQFSGC